MQLDKIIVGVFGFIGIAFTYWFFLMKKDKAVEVVGSIDIAVKGGYSPSTISIPVGKTTTLHLKRTDPSTCLEEIVFPDFKIRKYLPLNKTVSVEITPEKAGTYEIVCGMNMFHGKIIAK